jgi:hypothetical protein
MTSDFSLLVVDAGAIGDSMFRRSSQANETVLFHARRSLRDRKSIITDKLRIN